MTVTKGLLYRESDRSIMPPPILTFSRFPFELLDDGKMERGMVSFYKESVRGHNICNNKMCGDQIYLEK